MPALASSSRSKRCLALTGRRQIPGQQREQPGPRELEGDLPPRAEGLRHAQSVPVQPPEGVLAAVRDLHQQIVDVLRGFRRAAYGFAARFGEFTQAERTTPAPAIRNPTPISMQTA